ncbi:MULTISPECIES: acyltransferase family protein [unclassified Curtobacterium]|uniref:acyltransferase family protein n=1 Tax=unclassified Curtobacterium TaxID=257496 RepID=UPI000DAA2105|nr:MULTISPECIES: acyltransferase family protein [unclassified Curtobacterium]PZE28900.1 fucose 4-O-acetylase [Curtobacterium sp. MCBD17_028]PZF65281.1 fucose 4-O-acetylase [Curtobacterium sp. MCBD17_013]WIB66215.1 acyltransferase family protein [Curtobacterium sp. MCBD17_035]
MSTDVLSTAPSAPPVAPDGPAPARVRVPLWDTARFLAVTLVVIGHAIQRQTTASDHAMALYTFIYAFHIPAFGVISGYFSSSATPTAVRMRRTIAEIVVPYIVMQTIWTVVESIVEGRKQFNPTQPTWTLWFLLALGIFRLVLPYLAQLRWPLLWTVAASIGVGYLDNVDSTLSLSRAIGLMPFFVLGWQLKGWGVMDRWAGAPRRVVVWVRSAAVVVLAAWGSACVVFVRPFRSFELHHWFFYDDSYSGLGQDAWWAGFLRLGLMVLASALTASFLLLVPRRRVWLSAFGQATMYVYLLHTFVLYPIRESGVLSGPHSAWPYLLLMVALAITVAVLLATPPVRAATRWLLEPRVPLLFRRDPDQEPTSEATRAS